MKCCKRIAPEESKSRQQPRLHGSATGNKNYLCHQAMKKVSWVSTPQNDAGDGGVCCRRNHIAVSVSMQLPILFIWRHSEPAMLPPFAMISVAAIPLHMASFFCITDKRPPAFLCLLCCRLLILLPAGALAGRAPFWGVGCCGVCISGCAPLAGR